ncbi:darcynin family protein [Segniliparus rugosus]|uniref:darcynin family protein n=1 Tax=Segniliparus rugosus TaxID=286804 RepID=UPI001B7F9EFE
MDKRFAKLTTHSESALRRHPSVKLRWFDVEFSTTKASDILVWETTSQHEYELLVEELRETPLWDRYFTIVEILPGVENADADNDNRKAVGA